MYSVAGQLSVAVLHGPARQIHVLGPSVCRNVPGRGTYARV